MSTSDNLTQTLPTADAASSADLAGADQLKQAFADNECPDGADFERLIDSAFNKVDGPIKALTDPENPDNKSLAIETETGFQKDVSITGGLTAGHVNVNHSLSAAGDAAVGGTLTVSGASVTVGETQKATLAESGLTIGDRLSLTPDELTIGDKISLKPDQPLQVNTPVEVTEKTHLTGAASVSKTADQTDPALTIEGDMVSDSISVDNGKIMLGGELAHIAIDDDDTPEKLSLSVKHGEETVLALDKQGQLSLGLPAEQSNAKLHIRYRPDDGDTLLRIDNQANDDTPVAVTSDGQMGIGTASPHNMLDVTESMSIGFAQPQPVSPQDSLAVANRLGVGTASPMARVDIHTTTSEDAMIARYGDKKLLHVNQEGVTTETNLTVSGETNLKKTTVDGAFSVTQDSSLAGDLTIGESSHMKGTLTVDADTQLQTVTAAGKATLNKELIVAGDTKHDGSVGIGLGIGDTHNPDAGLHLRERDNQVALKIENKQGDSQLLVGSGKVRIGEEGTEKSIGLDVYGQTRINGQANITGDTDIDGALTVQQPTTMMQGAAITQSSPESQEPALKVRVNTDKTSVQIIHGEGDAEQTLFIATGDKVGIHQANPEKALHVSGESRFDDPAVFAESVTTGGKLIADSSLDLTGQLRINTEDTDKAQVHIARDETLPSLRVDGEQKNIPALLVKDGKIGIATETPQRHLDVQGDVGVSGHFGVGELLSAGDGTVTLTQQATTPVLTVKKNGEENSGISVLHDRIGINVTQPNAGLHLKGDALLEGTTTAEYLNVKEKLTVTGKTSLEDTDVTGQIRINTPVQENNVDLHVRQSGLSQTALRIDPTEKGTPSMVVKSGKTGLNLADPQSTLDVNGAIYGRDMLTIDGKLTAKAQSYFEKTAYVMENMAFSVETPKGRIHIAEQETDEAALRIDYGSGAAQTSLVARQGKLGIGVSNPKSALDVKGDTAIDGELRVDGTTFLDNYLNVAQDAVFDSDVVIKEKAKLKDQAIIGRSDEINPELTPNSQLYIADTHFKEAFRIDSADYPSLVFVDGRLGLGQNTPRAALDVAGEVYVSGPVKLSAELNVEGDITAINNIEGRGKLDVSQKATFGSDVLIRGDLYIEDKTDIEEELTVLGATMLKDSLAVTGLTQLNASLDVAGKTELSANLSVHGETQLKHNTSVYGTLDVGQSVSVGGSVSAGVSNAKAKLHLGVSSDQDGLLIERKDNYSTQPMLSLNRQGQLAIGKSAAQATLDVSGDACFSGPLQASAVTASGAVSGLEIKAGQSLRIGDTQAVKGISGDFRLGGDNSADTLIPTQSAVKAYIDNVVVPFGQGGKTYTISSQADFDDVFNRGEPTIVDSNTTVILLPLGNQDYGTTTYMLKNSVRLRQGVAIVGFNPLTTRIVKSQANHRFELIGTQGSPVTQVTFTGFTFDGRGMESGPNGGALYLEHVKDCIFNCRFENHTTWGDGGAIYAVMKDSADPYTVSHIEARYIFNCQARVQTSGTDVQRNEGGAAYGLDRSVIHAWNCSAEQGGAVSRCRASQVVAESCSASQHGGAAYRCPQLRLNACDCKADMVNGKGGAAYFCSDMICEGQWLNNNAAEGPHIYASNNLTGDMEERHYWKGDYIGRRIDDGTSVWRIHNE